MVLKLMAVAASQSWKELSNYSVGVWMERTAFLELDFPFSEWWPGHRCGSLVCDSVKDLFWLHPARKYFSLLKSAQYR